MGCQKDINPIDPADAVVSASHPSQRPISIEEAKAYFDSVSTPQNSNQLNSNPDEFRLTGVVPQWEFNQSGILVGRAALAVEATDGELGLGENGNIRLFFNRDSVGNLGAKFILYMPDSTYYKRKMGRYDFQDFTGIALVFRPDGSICDTLMSVNGRLVSKPSIRTVTSTTSIDFNALPIRCSSNEFQVTYVVRVACTPGCGCIACAKEVTNCIWVPTPQPTFLVSELFDIYSSSYALPVSSTGGTIPLASLQDHARYHLRYTANLSLVTIKRFEESFPSEFLRLGALVAIDGTASSDFARFYIFGLLSGQFAAIGNEANLRELYNLTFDMPNLEENFDAVAKYLISNNFSSNSEDLVRLHKQTLIEDDEYRQAHLNAGNPVLGTDAWVEAVWTIRDPGWNNLNAQEKALAISNPDELIYYRNASNKAIKEAQAVGLRRLGPTHNSIPGNDRNEINAFQHAYWNALLTIAMGATRTKVWADAHESGLPNNPDMNFATAMDFFNNEIGRNIGNLALAYPVGYNYNLSQIVENWVNQGNMKYVCFDTFTESNPKGYQYINQRLKYTNQTCP